MWLLDVNMPKKAIAVLAGLGITAHTAESRGWNGLTNGELVEAAAGAGFSCVLTRHRLFSESAARALQNFPRCGPRFVEQFRLAWAKSAILPVPGKLIRWPSA